MPPQRPPAMAAQYHLEKTSIMDLTLAAVPHLPYQPSGDSSHWGSKKRGGTGTVPWCDQLVLFAKVPVAQQRCRLTYSTTERSHHGLVFRVFLPRLDRNRAIVTLFSKQNAASYTSN